MAAESDFPDAFRANLYARGLSMTGDGSADQALRDYTRFPTWMWRNHVTVDFVEWLRRFNDAVPPEHQVLTNRTPSRGMCRFIRSIY